MASSATAAVVIVIAIATIIASTTSSTSVAFRRVIAVIVAATTTAVSVLVTTIVALAGAVPSEMALGAASEAFTLASVLVESSASGREVSASAAIATTGSIIARCRTRASPTSNKISKHDPIKK